MTEFYPVAEVAQYSTTAQQQLKMLYKFVSKQCVQEVLEVFMDDFFEHWRFLPRQDLVRICTYIFKTLVCTYEWCSKKPSRTVTRMEQFLSNSHIESLCSKGLGGLTKKDPRLSFDNEASNYEFFFTCSCLSNFLTNHDFVKCEVVCKRRWSLWFIEIFILQPALVV